jgi:hypothetical protein
MTARRLRMQLHDVRRKSLRIFSRAFRDLSCSPGSATTSGRHMSTGPRRSMLPSFVRFWKRAPAEIAARSLRGSKVGAVGRLQPPVLALSADSSRAGPQTPPFRFLHIAPCEFARLHGLADHRCFSGPPGAACGRAAETRGRAPRDPPYPASGRARHGSPSYAPAFPSAQWRKHP